MTANFYDQPIIYPPNECPQRWQLGGDQLLGGRSRRVALKDRP